MCDHYDESKVECYAELTISGKYLDVIGMSQQLGLTIIKEEKAGDYSGVIGEGVVVKTGLKSSINLWHYQTLQKHIAPNEALSELRGALIDKLEELKEVRRSNPELYFSICVVIYNHQQHLPSFFVDEQNVQFAAALETSIDFDLYHSGE